MRSRKFPQINYYSLNTVVEISAERRAKQIETKTAVTSNGI